MALSLRRLGPQAAAIAILIAISVLTLVSFGEGFKIFTVNNSSQIRKRNSSTIKFSLPWNSQAPATNAKGITSDLPPGYNAVSVLASILNVPSNPIVVVYSSASNGNFSKPSNTTIPTASMHISTTSSVSSATTSSPPFFTLNITSSASLPSLATFTSGTLPTIAQSSPASTSACPLMTMISLSCPAPVTSTCYITETWHSTHYESTATLYSFMSATTITYTETISICPQVSSSSYMFGANIKNPPAISHTALGTANGCPGCSPKPTTASSQPLIGLTSSLPASGGPYSYPSSLTATVAPLPTVVCADGSLEYLAKDCVFGFGVSSAMSQISSFSSIGGGSGILGGYTLPSLTSSLVPLSSLGQGLGGASSTMAFSTGVNSASISASAYAAQVSSALTNIPGLTGGLLSSIIAIVESANNLPTGGLGGNAASGVLTLPNIVPTFPNGGLNGVTVIPTRLPTAGVSGILPTVVSVANGVTGNLNTPSATSGLGGLGNGLVPAVTSVVNGATNINVPTVTGELGGLGNGLVPTVVSVVTGATNNLNVPTVTGGLGLGNGLVPTVVSVANEITSNLNVPISTELPGGFGNGIAPTVVSVVNGATGISAGGLVQTALGVPGFGQAAGGPVQGSAPPTTNTPSLGNGGGHVIGGPWGIKGVKLEKSQATLSTLATSTTCLSTVATPEVTPSALSVPVLEIPSLPNEPSRDLPESPDLLAALQGLGALSNLQGLDLKGLLGLLGGEKLGRRRRSVSRAMNNLESDLALCKENPGHVGCYKQ